MNNATQPSNVISGFDQWSIDLNHFSLRNSKGDEIFVEPRLLKLLHVLRKNSNQVVKRDELTSQVWEEVIVTDESLSKAIFDLRKFLNEQFNDAPEIMTIRKVGYKLLRMDSSKSIGNKGKARLFGILLLSLFICFIMVIIIARAIQYKN